MVPQSGAGGELRQPSARSSLAEPQNFQGQGALPAGLPLLGLPPFPASYSTYQPT